jgi:tetratricopeptide (TPR) repeat protein
MKTQRKFIVWTGVFLVFFIPLITSSQNSESAHAPVNELTIKFTRPLIVMPDPKGIVQLDAISAEIRDVQTYLQELDPKATITRYMPEFQSSDTLRINSHGKLVRSYDWSTVYTIWLSKHVPFYEVKEILESYYEIEWVDPPISIEPIGLPDDYGLELSQWNLDLVSAPAAWDITIGDAAVRVMVLDFGIRPHYDINNKVVNPGQSFSGNHGLQVAGIIGAETYNNLGLASLGWETMIVDGSFQEAVGPTWIHRSHSSNDEDHISDIINMSFLTFLCYEWDYWGNCIEGEMYNSSAYEEAISNAMNHNNRIVVAAAGNTQPSWHSGNWPTEVWPAAYPGVIAVSAVNSNDEFPSGYNSGEFVNLCAPGIQVPTLTANNGYTNVPGTSFSSPHVAAAAALIKSLNPIITPSQVKVTLEIAADKVSSMNGENFTNEYGYGRLNANKAVRNMYVPQVYPNIAAAVSVAVSGQTIYVSSGNYTLTSNVIIPSDVTLTLLSGANVNFNGRYIDATNGVFNIQNGSTVYVTNGNKRYYGLFTSVQSAINFASSGRTVQLLSMTYTGNLSFSSKSYVTLKGQGQGSTTLNGSISVTNSSSITVSNVTVTHPFTLNNANYTLLSNVTAAGNYLASVYGGTQNKFAQITAHNIGALTWALNVYGGTGEVYLSSIANADEVAIYLTNNASYIVGTDNMFCNNGLDIYAVGGGYAYAISNYYSRPLPSSIFGNVFVTGQNGVCGGGEGMYVLSKESDIQTADDDMRSLEDRYLELMLRMREDKENNTYDPEKYSQAYEELIDGYKSIITNKSDRPVISSAIRRLAQLYKETGASDRFRAYIENALDSGQFESLTPYFRRWALWDYVDANQYRESLEIADEVLSSTGADDDLLAEMLYEKGLVFKYYLNDLTSSLDMFAKLIDAYPSSPLSRFAEAEMKSEMFDIVQDETQHGIERLQEASSYRLESYPNPFNPSTVVRFSLPTAGMVKLRVFDTLGRVVAVLAEGMYEAGVHEATFDASRLPSGMYITRIEYDGKSIVRRVLLLK